ncbi:MAG: zinc ABC transporter substrate-binding protein [Clostridiales bacterium]|nr:zinc ABC transporter substrate-binding protein [Clostridiales bacterium]
MRKNIIFIFFAAVLVLSGCGAGSEDSGKLNVCTSFYAMYDFASEIGGDRVEIKNLVPNGAEPHDWEPSVGAMVSLEKADVFIYNGLGMEDFVDKVKNSVSGNLVYVEASEGCEILYGYEDDHHHEDEEEEEEYHHDVSDADPHVWLNPYNALKEAENICEAFCLCDSKNEEYYRENLRIFEEKIIELDKAYKEGLAGVENRNIIVSHGAYGYICDAYGLNQSAVEGMSGNSDPSPRRVREIYDFIRENNIDCIFYESLTGSRTAAAISEDLGIRLYPITAYDGLTAEQEKAGLNYFDVMYNNLDSFIEGLG